LTVKASAEFDHDGLGMGISRVFDEIPELIQTVVDCPFTLKVGSGLQHVAL